jgi:hypothetical protein
VHSAATLIKVQENAPLLGTPLKGAVDEWVRVARLGPRVVMHEPAMKTCLVDVG